MPAGRPPARSPRPLRPSFSERRNLPHVVRWSCPPSALSRCPLQRQFTVAENLHGSGDVLARWQRKVGNYLATVGSVIRHRAFGPPPPPLPRCTCGTRTPHSLHFPRPARADRTGPGASAAISPISNPLARHRVEAHLRFTLHIATIYPLASNLSTTPTSSAVQPCLDPG